MIDMRVAPVFVLALAFGLVVTAAPDARAERATQEEMEHVCLNWLAYMVDQTGGWAGSTEPEIVDTADIVAGDVILARRYSIAPAGFVLVPILKELPPVKAYSDRSGLDITQTVGLPQLLREILEDRVNVYIERYGSLDFTQPLTGEVLFDRTNREQWDRFGVEPVQFEAGLNQRSVATLLGAGPLLTSDWHQGEPYYNDCPIGYDGRRTVVGCVATAAAQVLRYHEWPPRGEGEFEYYWSGDNSCGGGSSPGGYLYADFSDAYDWDNMPDDCGGGCSTAEQAALAELSYEVGVAFRMDYGACGSGTYTHYALTALPTYFGYRDSIDRENRSDHTPDSWFALIKWEVNSNRPMLYTFYAPTWGHAIVCDGWRETDNGTKQYHMNYGWGGGNTAWYTIDQLAFSADFMDESLIRQIEPDAEACGTVYDVYFGTENPPTTLICESLASPECDPGALASDTTYYWQICATNPIGTTVGDVWSFTTAPDGPDCNGNQIPDVVDIAQGTSRDCNGNAVPDECDLPGDWDGDDLIGLSDFVGLASCMTSPCGDSGCDPPMYADPCCSIPDFNADGGVDLLDYAAFEQALAE
jgi:hypothetical protein